MASTVNFLAASRRWNPRGSRVAKVANATARTSSFGLTGSSVTTPQLSQKFCSAPKSEQLRLSSGASARTSFSARNRRVKVLASWGKDVEWFEASVSEISKASSMIWNLKLDVGPISEGYTKPGQFVQAKVGDSKPGFFAIASPPARDNNDYGKLQLLVKAQGGTAELLCKLSPGEKVEVSPVMGKGFPVERLQPPSEFPTVLLFATGSGISPVKALIESGALEPSKRSNVTLYFGASDKEAMACKELFEGWAKMGVSVVPVLSSDGKGYVQDVFASSGGVSSGQGVGAVLCGQKEMATAIRQSLTAAGVPEDCILTNF